MAYGGHLYLVCALCDGTIWCHIHVSKPTFWLSLLNNVHILLHALTIIYVTFQARSQLGTPGGAKSFLRGAQIFWTMSNSFKLYPTHFSGGAKNFLGGDSPPLVTGLHWSEYKLSALQVRISEENKLNTTTQQFITAKISGYARGGRLIWLSGHFEKAAFSGGPYLLMEIEASLG